MQELLRAQHKIQNQTMNIEEYTRSNIEQNTDQTSNIEEYTTSNIEQNTTRARV